jgi:cytoskeletal protein CcmA (bactofilin family)
MMTTPIAHARSERGIALVVVLLLMAVLSGLATGFAMNGQVESSMANNEVYYAGARAAAEAGMNRSIETIRTDTTTDLLSGVDAAVDPLIAADTGVNEDNGDVGFMLTGAAPYALDPGGQYTYTIEVFDDDDPRLYTTALTPAQLLAMGAEDGSGFYDQNDQLILRATGFGPSNTVVTLSRVLLSQESVVIPPPSLNPAILVNGDLNIGGNITIEGDAGSVHANGDLTVDGNSATIEENATASGDFSANDNFTAGGTQGGGYANINVPEINASDYAHLADFILQSDGTVTNGDGSACLPCPGDWSFSGGTWSITGSTAPTGTFFVEGAVSISGSPKGPGSTNIAMSVIATGSITITGSPKLQPDNVDKFQFITDGDFVMAGAVDLDDPTEVEGQILVREQIHISGNPEFQGRILVGDAADVFDDVTTSAIPGNPTFTYNGTLGAFTSPGGPTTYTNNVTGWIEQ